MKRIAIYGEYRTDADHPFYRVEKFFKELFGELGEVHCISDYRTGVSLENYDLLILYNDTWEEKLPPESVSRLLQFVSEGKTIIGIHCGIFYLQANPEFQPLIAGSFYHHPPRTKMKYYLADHTSGTEGKCQFELWEEPYLFRFSENVSKKVFLLAEYEDEYLPAGWMTDFGKGHFIYFAPGHDLDSFLEAAYCEILLKYAGKYLE